MVVEVGINGFGRIGKTIFLQLLNETRFIITAVNAPGFDLKNLETYLKYDSIHKYTFEYKVKLLDDNIVEINGKTIKFFNTRNAKEIKWRKYNVKYLMESSGAYLTTEKCKEHDVDYVIMSAPPKDNTPIFVNEVNHLLYKGEKIVSNASCTTNCIAPVLKFLDDNYSIKNVNFTTIHSATSSQTTVDVLNSNSRTHRSILNNIIPHTTGASSSLKMLLPKIGDKIKGTSLRVPVSNVSIVDLNIEFDTKYEKDGELFKNIMDGLENHKFIKVSKENLVSSDFLTTTCPSIVDKNASFELTENSVKLMIWYDNEWSYSAQMCNLMKAMDEYNSVSHCMKNEYFIENYNFKNKRVVLRVDWNVPTTKNYEISDKTRIIESIPTIKKILNDNPLNLTIVSHFGRPNGYSEKLSWRNYIKQIEEILGEDIIFLDKGLSEETYKTIFNNTTPNKIFLLENVRFHEEEVNYEKEDRRNNDIVKIINNICDIYVNDAFGCMHRNHLSICGITEPHEKCYGYLVRKEIEMLNKIIVNKENKKILAIFGGAKFEDKFPLIEVLSKKVDDIYIAGNNINEIYKNNCFGKIDIFSKNKANIHLMTSGICGNTYTSFKTKLIKDMELQEYAYDIGEHCFDELKRLIEKNDIVFWNGNLGMTENELFKKGSEYLVNELKNSNKQVLIAGGNTVDFVNNYEHNFDISTGGGSSLDYIANGSIVGWDYFK
jgi:glyceraldehyde 3-phosphate dehydrogenase